MVSETHCNLLHLVFGFKEQIIELLLSEYIIMAMGYFDPVCLGPLITLVVFFLSNFTIHLVLPETDFESQFLLLNSWLALRSLALLFLTAGSLHSLLSFVDSLRVMLVWETLVLFAICMVHVLWRISLSHAVLVAIVIWLLFEREKDEEKLSCLIFSYVIYLNF